MFDELYSRIQQKEDAEKDVLNEASILDDTEDEMFMALDNTELSENAEDLIDDITDVMEFL